MSSGRDAVAKRVVHLFGEGTVAGLTERQLLDRFVARRDEVAFEAILNRHGPMVLGVCRRSLRDPRDVEDAFQATFLVLVRRAEQIRDRELIGPWLHKVARRVVARASIEAARRRAREGPCADELADPSPAASDFASDLRPAIDEELGRLPEKYRSPVVLCYLEGRTHEEAAVQLQWPVGTVKGRLSRARDLLRGRLARRGFAPTAGVLVAALASEARSAVPEELAAHTIQSASRLTVGGGLAVGTVPAAVVSLVEGVAKTMLMNKLRALAVGVLAFGAVALGAEAIARQFGGGGGFGGQPAASKADPDNPNVRPSGKDEARRGGGTARKRRLPSSTDPAKPADDPAKVPGALPGGGGLGGEDAEGGAMQETAATELDEASIQAELLELELSSVWLQLQMRLRDVRMSEQEDQADPDESPNLDPKKARERYEEIRKSYQEKSLKLGRAKRQIRRLMSLLHETEEPPRREANMMGMGGMGGGMGGIGGMGGGMGGRGGGIGMMGMKTATVRQPASKGVNRRPEPDELTPAPGEPARLVVPSPAPRVDDNPKNPFRVVIPIDPDARKRRLSEVDQEIERLNRERNLLIGGNPS